MVELGELENHYKEFAGRGVRVAVISNDDLETARLTQTDFPHLLVIADTDQRLARAVQIIDPGHGPGGSDTNAPAMFLLDGAGNVRWFHRSERFLSRLPPDDVLQAIDRFLPASSTLRPTP